MHINIVSPIGAWTNKWTEYIAYIAALEIRTQLHFCLKIMRALDKANHVY